MKILFDQGVPVPLRSHLAEHQVETAYERGWATLKNGEFWLPRSKPDLIYSSRQIRACPTNRA